MPRRRRATQGQTAEAEHCVLDVAAVFPPQQIAAGLGRLWVLDGRQLAPALDVAGGAWECPITLEAIASPVMLGDGHVYEEEAILQWLQRHTVSPCTNLPLEHRSALKLTPLQQTFEHFLLQSPKPRPCPLDRMRRAARDAEASVAHPCATLERLEAHLADVRLYASELQAELERASALAARMQVTIGARKERCAVLAQAAFRSFQARRAVAQLRREAALREGALRALRRRRAVSTIKRAWRGVRIARCAARIQDLLGALRRRRAAMAVQRAWRGARRARGAPSLRDLLRAFPPPRAAAAVRQQAPRHAEVSQSAEVRDTGHDKEGDDAEKGHQDEAAAGLGTRLCQSLQMHAAPVQHVG